MCFIKIIYKMFTFVVKLHLKVALKRLHRYKSNDFTQVLVNIM